MTVVPVRQVTFLPSTKFWCEEHFRPGTSWIGKERDLGVDGEIGAGWKNGRAAELGGVVIG